MTAPLTTIGSLVLKNQKQVTVIKMYQQTNKQLKAKSAQISNPYKVTFYEWGEKVAFSFESDGKEYFLKVKEGIPEVVEDDMEDKYNDSLEEYLFKWVKEDQGEWHHLEHNEGEGNMFLCCDESGSFFLTGLQSMQQADCYLYKKMLEI
ncbi:unnamed protein product [Lota lota]